LAVGDFLILFVEMLLYIN